MKLSLNEPNEPNEPNFPDPDDPVGKLKFELEHLGLREDEDNYQKIDSEIEKLYAKVLELKNRRSELRYIIDSKTKRRNELTILIEEEMALQESLALASKQAEELKGIAEQFPWYDKLRPFQWEGIVAMHLAYSQGKRGFLLADDMGLGKTFQTIAFDAIVQPQKAIWITKKSLRGSTAREFRTWNPTRKVVYLQGPREVQETTIKMARDHGILLIVNYEAMNTFESLRTDWDCMYIDEVHKLKGGANPGGPTQVWQHTKEASMQTTFSVFLSGTPIQNHPREMWAYLHLFDPEKFPNTRDFEARFCSGYGETWSVDFDRLIKILTDNVIRRSKQDVGLQLPPKIYDTRLVEMTPSQEALYQQLRTNFFVWLDEQEGKALTATALIAQLTRLRQLVLLPSGIRIKLDDGTEEVLDCNESGKLDETMELVDELYLLNEQVVIWSSQFNEPLYELKRRFDRLGLFRSEVLDGSADPTELERAFQQGEIQVLLVNGRSGAEGLNLQKSPDFWPGGASHAIFLDRWWNPAINTQCEDRIYRQGQTDTVEIHIMHCPSSVDDYILEIIEQKQQMVEGIMESRDLRTALEDLI